MRGNHAEVIPVLEECRRVGGGELPDRNPLGRRGLDDLVVDVGEVHDVKDVITAGLEPSPEEVDKQERPEVADVGVVIDRGATRIESGLRRRDRLERFDPASEGVIE